MSDSRDSLASSSAKPPISVGLLSRRSIVGALVVLGVALVYIVVLPMADSAITSDGESLAVGEAHPVGCDILLTQITPQPGWELDPVFDELYSSFSKSGASLLVVAAFPSTQTAEELMQTSVDAIAADSNTTWTVGDPQTFVTDAGDHGIKVVSHSPREAQENWVFVVDGHATTLLATSPDGVWTSIVDELDAMVRSVRFVPQAADD